MIVLSEIFGHFFHIHYIFVEGGMYLKFQVFLRITIENLNLTCILGAKHCTSKFRSVFNFFLWKTDEKPILLKILRQSFTKLFRKFIFCFTSPRGRGTDLDDRRGRAAGDWKMDPVRYWFLTKNGPCQCQNA